MSGIVSAHIQLFVVENLGSVDITSTHESCYHSHMPGYWHSRLSEQGYITSAQIFAIVNTSEVTTMFACEQGSCTAERSSVWTCAALTVSTILYRWMREYSGNPLISLRTVFRIVSR